jgi:hypothetical protein
MKHRTRVRLEYSVYGQAVSLDKKLEVLRTLLSTVAGRKAAKVFDIWTHETASRQPKRTVRRAARRVSP